MINLLIGFVGLFRPVYRAMGVDFDQLRAIVRIKLTMDNRRNTSAFPQKKKQKDSNYAFLLSVLFYAFFGAFVALALYSLPSLLVGTTLFFSFLMVTIIMTLISDFSSVLLDTSDNTIILPRPVSGKTLVAARTTHILLYLGQITLGLLICPLIAVTLKFGAVFAVLFFVAALLAVLFAVTFTNGFYLVLMQLTSEEKLKSIINYFQIGMTIVIMGGYQIIPRIMGDTLSAIKDFDLSWWSVFVPPMWMAGAVQLYHDTHINSIHILNAVLAVGAPIGGFYLMNRYLAPKFASNLADLGTNAAIQDQQQEKVPKSSFSFGRIFNKAGLEEASYDFTGKFLARDRKLKLKIYPSIGTMVIMVAVILMQGRNKLNLNLETLREGSGYILLLYASYFVVQTAITEIVYSDDFKAAWIFTSTPVKHPGLILSGAWKAVLVKFFLPVFGVVAVVIVSIWGTKAIDDIIFALSGNLFLFFTSAMIAIKRLPLSNDPAARSNTGFLRSILTILLLGAVGGGHYLLTFVPWATVIAPPFLFGAAYMMMRNFQDTKWEEIRV